MWIQIEVSILSGCGKKNGGHHATWIAKSFEAKHECCISIVDAGRNRHSILCQNVPIIAERQSFFNSGSLVGSTTSMGSNNAHTSWYIAQGDTSSGHMEALAVTNPNTSAAVIQVVYYAAAGQPVVKTYTLAGYSRMTINLVNDVGVNTSVGIAVYATLLVAVEQAMFFNSNGATGGYASMGLGE
jgi:hypothetical protein